MLDLLGTLIAVASMGFTLLPFCRDRYPRLNRLRRRGTHRR